MKIGDKRAPDAEGLPDFIIVGAPKCGTTSLHALLDLHPGVFLPEGEVFFFDVDDVMTHPDFFVHRGGLSFHDYDADYDAYLAWYRSLFIGAKPGQLIGEDTTTYLGSPSVPGRLERLLPDVKLIALLRDPVNRTYSQYLHNVRSGRHTLSFERSLRNNPGSLIYQGFYAEHLARYRAFLDAGQMLVLFFEDFVADPAAQMRKVCEFLGLEELPAMDAGAQHSNKARPPLHFGSRLIVNHWLGHRFAFPTPRPNLPGYAGPEVPGAHARTFRWYEKAALWFDEHVPRSRPPAMRPETQAHLQKVFAKRNAKLGELLDCDVGARWPYMA